MPRQHTVVDLSEIATTLLETARKLPPGLDRHEILKMIGKFRVRINALEKKSERSASIKDEDDVSVGLDRRPRDAKRKSHVHR
jgi:hypothetical protein